ncbi:hypothetical protein [Flavobacterium sp.]|uniref:hypothetical protein n=1 Tax=Flavobacterium sp. TaxID=239 RepID=UPI0039E22D5A
MMTKEKTQDADLGENDVPNNEKSPKSYSKPTDPYGSSLAYFFKKVMPTNERQRKLYAEFTTYADLKPFIKVEKDNDGILISLEIKKDSENDYEATRARLISEGVQLP